MKGLATAVAFAVLLGASGVGDALLEAVNATERAWRVAVARGR